MDATYLRELELQADELVTRINQAQTPFEKLWQEKLELAEHYIDGATPEHIGTPFPYDSCIENVATDIVGNDPLGGAAIIYSIVQIWGDKSS
jgi:hypothetical protein